MPEQPLSPIERLSLRAFSESMLELSRREYAEAEATKAREQREKQLAGINAVLARWRERYSYLPFPESTEELEIEVEGMRFGVSRERGTYDLAPGGYALVRLGVCSNCGEATLSERILGPDGLAEAVHQFRPWCGHECIHPIRVEPERPEPTLEQTLVGLLREFIVQVLDEEGLRS